MIFARQVAVLELERPRQLGVGRFAPKLACEALQCLVDARSLEAHEARDPVLAAQLVEDRPADARGAVGLELDATGRIEAADGVH